MYILISKNNVFHQRLCAVMDRLDNTVKCFYASPSKHFWPVWWHTLILSANGTFYTLPTLLHFTNGHVFLLHNTVCCTQEDACLSKRRVSNWAAPFCTSYHTSTAWHKQQCVCECVRYHSKTHSARKESHARGGKAGQLSCEVTSCRGVKRGRGGSTGRMQLWGLTLTQRCAHVSR